MRIDIVEERVQQRPKFREDAGKYVLVLRLHGFENEYMPHIVYLSWENGGDRLILKTSRDTLEEIKGYLVKRDSPMDVVWSLIQYEYRTMERLENKVEALQNKSLHEYSSSTLQEILKVKKTLFAIHKDYIRMRNVLEWAVENGNEDASQILRDVNELIDGIEYLVDGATVAIQLMQNTVTMKMNEVMKILTIIATIMMPLTLITGIYGMNFRNMPEIQWEYGYFYSLALMFLVAIFMLYYFKKRGLL